jgi:hypothetical protein
MAEPVLPRHATGRAGRALLLVRHARDAFRAEQARHGGWRSSPRAGDQHVQPTCRLNKAGTLPASVVARGPCGLASTMPRVAASASGTLTDMGEVTLHGL